MNNFSYRDKFITERNAPIMGKKPTSRNYGIIRMGEFKSYDNPRTVGFKGMSTTQAPYETVRDLGSLFAGQQLNQSSNG